MVKQKDRVESILEFRGSFLELLVVAVAIGLGINLLAGAIGPLIGVKWSILLSVGLVGLGCAILLARLVPKINRRLSLEGAISITKGGKVAPIDRYDFSERLHDYFRALFLENKAIEQTWSKSKHTFRSKSEMPSASKEKLAESVANKKLVREAVEYFILDRLSMTLTDYFNQNSVNNEQATVTLERNDIPSVLLSNRFLDLFSRPMEEREPFSSFSRDDSSQSFDEGTQVKLVAAYTAEGAIFDSFELVLPKGSAVSRGSDHSLSIDTKRFSLRGGTIFEGYATVFPPNFDELYLDPKADLVKPYQVDVNIDVKLKWRALLSQRGWQYFRWIDIFMKKLETQFYFEHFLQEVGWNTANSVALVIRRSQSPRRAPKRSP